MRKKAVGLISMLLITFGAYSGAKADTVLFPVLALSPGGGVITVVSVTNEGPSTNYLLYSYSFKDAIVSGVNNYSGGCGLANIVNTDYAPDIVSFDASGLLGGGFALFNDPDFYSRPFNIPVAGGPFRAYLLVSNSDSAGNRVDVGATASLRGEANIMDIGSGSAWGYRAVNDQTREDFSFYPALVETGGLVNVANVGGTSYRFTFFDLFSWTTRFFVTPIGFDMYGTDRSTTIELLTAAGVPGVNGRGADIYNFTIPVNVVCTAAVNLTDLMDSTTIADLEFTGGWGRIAVTSGDSAIIYKLEYTFASPYVPPGASNNNGFKLTDTD